LVVEETTEIKVLINNETISMQKFTVAARIEFCVAPPATN